MDRIHPREKQMPTFSTDGIVNILKQEDTGVRCGSRVESRVPMTPGHSVSWTWA